ncbi:hypothetical protein DVA86_01105 [Streptomyces armeniacus]|uniref:DUF748 domain-containing protein n=1 Tax=Streptomyces armeniacus TaxID=83291 RepID=A0A345XII2_9ACTN|nr:hypothetical protein [Streptomyces armeniacus]AXK31448.1 hypothetical protein DVA86_01105 [Streptomyces armeniacus]
MNTGLKITVFATALAAVFGGAYGVGTGLDPLADDPEPAAHSDHRGEESGAPDGRAPAAADEPVGGLRVSSGGYSLDLRTPRVEADRAATLRFRVLDRDGRPLTEYRPDHDKELHLIVASRDLGTYRHVHPTRAADGTWSTRLTLPRAGDHRVFADFVPGDGAKGGEAAEDVTLGADLAVAGPYEPRELPEPARTADTDGYRVRLDGSLRPGTARKLTLTVTKDGKPVTDLQPYLGAYGHLVALRSGDLAYLHVHPNGEPGDGRTRPGPGVSFTATAPSSGAYRLFLDFKHEGEVRTAAFTVRADGTAGQDAHEEGGSGESGEGAEHGH